MTAVASREFNHGAVYSWHGVFMKKVIIAGVLVVLGLLGLWFYARPVYKQHREARALAQAKSYLAKGDYRNASLSARKTMGVNPRNLEACRIMAELAERSRSPAVLDWRRRMVELAPPVQNKLLLASTALRSTRRKSPTLRGISTAESFVISR